MQIKDQLNRTVTFESLPKRIISLVPSQTELLHDLGLEEEVVGITKFCVHPESWHRTKPHVGGTKKLHLDKIRQLSPDLIIGNKEENTKEDIHVLMEEFPVWMSDINNLDDALEMIAAAGSLTGKTVAATEMATVIRSAFDTMSLRSKPTVLYFIWNEPLMAAGKDTFIGDMLSRCGMENLAGSSRYPELNSAGLAALNPSTILLSSEPFPFAQKHADELRTICPDSNILFVDGEMFSWYGSRLRQAVPYFKGVLDQIHAGY